MGAGPSIVTLAFSGVCLITTIVGAALSIDTLAFSGVCLSTTRDGGCSAAFPTPYNPPNPRSLTVIYLAKTICRSKKNTLCKKIDFLHRNSNLYFCRMLLIPFLTYMCYEY